MKVAIVTEYYPRAGDPVLGIWAHRQALAARDAGADVRVIALHRPVPTRSSVRARDLRAIAAPFRQPRRGRIDGLDVQFVPFLAPPRWRSYASWGAWAAPTLGLALRHLCARFPFDLLHAHYAVPAGDAALRARVDVPLVISEHGGDVFSVAPGSPAGEKAVRRAFAAARLVLANSAAIERRCRGLGADRVRVVHLGTDLPPHASDPPRNPVLTTVAHLVPRKRHADVLRAVWLLRERHPALRYVIVGDGPERPGLERMTAELDLADRVEFRGQLPPAQAADTGRQATAFVMPSVDEAFGVAYIEAMAGGVPAIGCRGEDGPEEIAAAGAGIRLVPPGDVPALAAEIDAVLTESDWQHELRGAARATVRAAFTWERCGAATVAAYEAAMQ